MCWIIYPEQRGFLVERRALDFQNSEIYTAWCTAWFTVLDNCSSDGLAAMLPCRRGTPRSPLTAILLPRARLALPSLIRSIRGLNAALAAEAAIPLIGAGPGLTPSWDDLLVGLLSGLGATGNGESQIRFIGQFGSATLAASAPTTAVSRRYIESASRGDGPVWIENMLAAIAAGDLRRTRSTAAIALGVGHTSGIDMMLGAILGAAVWQTSSAVDEVLGVLSCVQGRIAQ